MHLRHTASAVDWVLGRSVYVPADHVGCDPVERDVGEFSHGVFVIMRCERWAVSPVEVVARDVLRIVPELRFMDRGEALSGGQADGSLLSAVLAEEVFCAGRISAWSPDIQLQD